MPGIEVNSGALGHGLSLGVGIAIVAKMDVHSLKTQKCLTALAYFMPS